MNPRQNNNCDGSRCTVADSEVRVLPYGGDGNLLVCRACYQHELEWRRERIKEGVAFKLPEWESLEVYA